MDEALVEACEKVMGEEVLQLNGEGSEGISQGSPMRAAEEKVAQAAMIGEAVIIPIRSSARLDANGGEHSVEKPKKRKERKNLDIVVQKARGPKARHEARKLVTKPTFRAGPNMAWPGGHRARAWAASQARRAARHSPTYNGWPGAGPCPLPHPGGRLPNGNKAQEARSG
ncbi:hypothetical protein E2562_018660 [Oryza meyeriana var. granulata]|uniref:Uncharacterized protein n=1 Tax=Oryza meyeriana var. granulata TaxID=110450 RepID=A0A6G1BYU3_9ORYZ|nr:hypothetical protein E2562_018660 [Oryza meyeriana var. granulata]